MKQIAVIFYLLAAAGLSAWQPTDLSGPLYEDLSRWEAQGLTGTLPHLKPYPVQLITAVLEKVKATGNTREQERAAAYLLDISSQLNKLKAQGFTDSVTDLKDDLFSANGLYLGLNSRPVPEFALSGKYGFMLLDRGNTAEGNPTAFPGLNRTPYDFIVDDSAFDVAGRTLLVTMSGSGLISYGNESLWFQGGLSRNSFGKFTDGMVLSEAAPQTTGFSLTWNTPGFIYSKYLLVLGATKDDRSLFKSYQDFYPNKYLSGQSFQWEVADWANVGLFESVVFGQRLEPYYLLPVIPSLYSSIYTGMHDNIFVGATAAVKLPGKIRWDLVWHADDLSFLKLFTLDFSGKTKIAVQTGLSWNPGETFLDSLSLDYSLVTPYTFTHYDSSINDVDDPVNYVNYTHNGQGLVGLEPNSDRVRASLILRPLDGLQVTLGGQIKRHGNASDDFSQYTAADVRVGTSDGGFNDNGNEGDAAHRFETNHFLTQSVIETLASGSLELKWQGVVAGLLASSTAGYTLEQGWNRRNGTITTVNSGSTWYNWGSPVSGNDGLNHHLKIQFGLEY